MNSQTDYMNKYCLKDYNSFTKKKYKQLLKKNYMPTYIPKTKIEQNYYTIHDNGGTPFSVYVSSKYIKIIQSPKFNKKDSIKPIIEGNTLKIKKFKGVFLGFDTGLFTNGNGNTILIKLNKNKYIFIGDEILYIDTKDEILNYYSPIGNNDVPYPIAYGTNFVYSLNMKAYSKISDFEIELNAVNSDLISGMMYGIGIPKIESKKMTCKTIIDRDIGCRTDKNIVFNNKSSKIILNGCAKQYYFTIKINKNGVDIYKHKELIVSLERCDEYYYSKKSCLLVYENKYIVISENIYQFDLKIKFQKILYNNHRFYGLDNPYYYDLFSGIKYKSEEKIPSNKLYLVKYSKFSSPIPSKILYNDIMIHIE